MLAETREIAAQISTLKHDLADFAACIKHPSASSLHGAFHALSVLLRDSHTLVDKCTEMNPAGFDAAKEVFERILHLALSPNEWAKRLLVEAEGAVEAEAVALFHVFLGGGSTGGPRTSLTDEIARAHEAYATRDFAECGKLTAQLFNMVFPPEDGAIAAAEEDPAEAADDDAATAPRPKACCAIM